MSEQNKLNTNPHRDASDSIRGYVYQAYQTVFAWICLKENQVLVLEGAEDFDVHENDKAQTTQVKDVGQNLTLRSSSVLDALNNFWDHCEQNPGNRIEFRFLSTAQAGLEQGSPFGKGIKGLETWKSFGSKSTPIAPLRKFLLSLELSAGLKDFVQKATDEQLADELIKNVNWDLGAKTSEAQSPWCKIPHQYPSLEGRIFTPFKGRGRPSEFQEPKTTHTC